MNKKTAQELYDAFNGIITISGEKGVGKTSMSLGFPADYSKAVFFNFDEKPLGGVEKTFMFYRNYFPLLADLESSGKAENNMLAEFLADVETLISQQEKPSVVIVDSVERVLSAFLPYVLKHSGQMKEFVGAGVWAQRSKIGHAKVFSTAFFSKIRDAFDCPVILIAHLDNKYVDDVAVGKEPKLNEIVNQKALFSVWLMHNQGSPVPNGLTIKRIHKSVATDFGLRQISVLPPKINHNALPDYYDREFVSLWDIIAHYWEHPTGLRELEDYEKLDEEEFALISESLTETQKAILAVKAQKGALSETDEMIVEQIVSEHIAKPLPVIISKVREEFGQEVSKSAIENIVNKLK